MGRLGLGECRGNAGVILYDEWDPWSSSEWTTTTFVLSPRSPMYSVTEYLEVIRDDARTRQRHRRASRYPSSVPLVATARRYDERTVQE